MNRAIVKYGAVVRFFLCLGGEFMKVVKVFNNNVVATLTKDGKEAIVTGTGVGFRKAAGDEIDGSKVQKKYVIEKGKQKKVYQLMERTPYEYVILAEDILDKVRKELYEDVKDSGLIGLTDHIAFAINREKNGIQLPNLVLNETKWLYPREYEIAQWAILHIKKKTGVLLPEDEAGYIAIHIINAISSRPDEDALEIVEFTRHILAIIQREMGVSIQSDGLDYSRLLTHIKFLAKRIMTKDHSKLPNADTIFQELVKDNQNVKRCISCINTYLKVEYHVTMNRDEMVYLSIHILRIMKSE